MKILLNWLRRLTGDRRLPKYEPLSSYDRHRIEEWAAEVPPSDPGGDTEARLAFLDSYAVRCGNVESIGNDKMSQLQIIGASLGEIVRTSTGGDWVRDQTFSGLRSFAIRWEKRVIYPFKWVQERIDGDETPLQQKFSFFFEPPIIICSTRETVATYCYDSSGIDECKRTGNILKKAGIEAVTVAQFSTNSLRIEVARADYHAAKEVLSAGTVPE
jgi:hypothetical protein